MERQLDREAGAVLRARIEGLGIRVLLEASTDAILGDGRVEALRLKDRPRERRPDFPQALPLGPPPSAATSASARSPTWTMRPTTRSLP
jgi:nitrite reductase (NADH) large subunit